MPDGNADPNERAGFMLIPEIGASKVMYVATSTLAQAPRYREIRGSFETRKTTLMMPIAMTNSASVRSRCRGHVPNGRMRYCLPTKLRNY